MSYLHPGSIYEKHADWRPTPAEWQNSIQICTNELGVQLWREIDRPGKWYRKGRGSLEALEVPYSVWSRFVDDPEAEMRGAKLIADQERVRGLVADAAKGKATDGPEQNGYHLRELPGGMALVFAGTVQLHPVPLPMAVAEGILAELAGSAEREGEDDA